MSNTLQQFLQCYRDCIRSFTLLRNRHSMLGNAHRIHKEETIFAYSVRSNSPQLLIANGTHTTPFHLNEKRFRLHITHKHHHFKRFHVRTCSHQSASNSNTEVTIIAELANQFIAITRRISNFLHIPIHISIRAFLSKHLFSYVHNIRGMSLVESKDECFGEIFKIRLTLWVIKHFRVNSIAICCKDEFYLRRIDNRTVKFRFGVILCLACI